MAFWTKGLQVRVEDLQFRTLWMRVCGIRGVGFKVSRLIYL